MNLVGFLNRSRSYPSPLISVGAEGHDLFAFYPSGDRVKLRGIESIEALKSRDSFLPAQSSEESEIPSLAFGISPKQVVAGQRSDVGRMLRTYMSQQRPLAPDDGEEAIKSFLLSIGEFTGRISARELVDVLSGRRRLTAKVRPRQLRRSSKTAHTLIVQLSGPGKTRTLYRKGMPYGKSLADIRIPAPTVTFLQQQLF
jgi:hypothetical protein